MWLCTYSPSLLAMVTVGHQDHPVRIRSLSEVDDPQDSEAFESDNKSPYRKDRHDSFGSTMMKRERPSWRSWAILLVLQPNNSKTRIGLCSFWLDLAQAAAFFVGRPSSRA